MLKASHMFLTVRTKSKLILQNNTWFSWKSSYYNSSRNLEMKVHKTVTSWKSGTYAKIPYKFPMLISRLTIPKFF